MQELWGHPCQFTIGGIECAPRGGGPPRVRIMIGSVALVLRGCLATMYDDGDTLAKPCRENPGLDRAGSAWDCPRLLFLDRLCGFSPNMSPARRSRTGHARERHRASCSEICTNKPKATPPCENCTIELPPRTNEPEIRRMRKCMNKFLEVA